MLTVITPTHAQRASKVGMVLAGVNYLDMLSKYRLAGQKRQYRLLIWEAQRYTILHHITHICVFIAAVLC